MAHPLQSRLPTFAVLRAADVGLRDVPSLSVTLSQPPASDARWRIRAHVQTTNGRAELCSMVTSAPTLGARSNRVVLIASCPGATGWLVMVEPVSGTPQPNELIELAASECCTGQGATALEGELEPQAGQTRGYHTYSTGDDVAGVLTVPAGEEVVGIGGFCAAGVVNATIQVGANTPAPVPQGGATRLSPPLDPRTHQGTLRGPVNITFANCLGFTVEVLR